MIRNIPLFETFELVYSDPPMNGHPYEWGLGQDSPGAISNLFHGLTTKPKHTGPVNRDYSFHWRGAMYSNLPRGGSMAVWPRDHDLGHGKR